MNVTLRACLFLVGSLFRHSEGTMTLCGWPGTIPKDVRMAVGGQAVLRHMEGRQGVEVQEWVGTRSPTARDRQAIPNRMSGRRTREGPTAMGDSSGKCGGEALLCPTGQGFSSHSMGGHEPA